MPILKKYTESFVAMPNATAQDTRLSLDALGALTRLASHSDNFQFKVEWLQQSWGIGRDKIQRVLRELREAGYFKTVPLANDDGTFLGHEWHISTTPIFEPSTDGLTESRKTRPSVNPVFYKKELNEKKELNKDTDKNARADFDFPLSQLFDAFPELELAPSQCDIIQTAVTLADAEAWRLTIQKYKENHDPMLGRYDPSKVGNVLSVFRDFKAKEQTNGTNRQASARPAKRTDREVIERSADWYAEWERTGVKPARRP